MSTDKLVAVHETAAMRRDVEADFRRALSEAHPAHPWREIADAAGLSVTGVRYLVLREREEGK